MAKLYKVRKKCMICGGVFYPRYAGSLYCETCKSKKVETVSVKPTAKPVKKAAKKPALKPAKAKKPAKKQTRTKKASKSKKSKK